MIEKFSENLYKGIVIENMDLYRQFFNSDPNEDGVIEYWKNAITLYDKLNDSEREVLLSIIKSTIVDTISNVLAILDGNESMDGIDIQVKINDTLNDGDLQDTFLAYTEELEE